MSDDDKIKKLGVRFKQPAAEDENTLRIVHFEKDGCNHKWKYVDGVGMVNAQYLIREGETEVECSLCNTRLDPMFVLRELACKEHRWNHQRQTYQEEMRRLSERTRTKCDHCGKMTRISNR